MGGEIGRMGHARDWTERRGDGKEADERELLGKGTDPPPKFVKTDTPV